MFRILILLLWTLTVFCPVASMASEVVYDRILVKINDDIITQFDLTEKMKPIYAKLGNRTLTASEKDQLNSFKKQTLEDMINDKLMAQEIKKYEIVIPDSAVDDEIRRVKQERGLNDSDFEEMVKQDGLTMDEFRERLRSMIEKQELLGYMVHSKVLVTDSEIQADYEAHRDDYLLEKIVSLAIVMLPANTSATEVKKRIDDGEILFSEAAEKYSIGPGKNQGGAIGDVEWSDLADDWRSAIEGVKEGGVSTPIVVQGKESLLSPVKITEDRLVPLEEVRDEIFKRLMDSKREKIFTEYFEKLKQSSVIVYMD